MEEGTSALSVKGSAKHRAGRAECFKPKKQQLSGLAGTRGGGSLGEGTAGEAGAGARLSESIRASCPLRGQPAVHRAFQGKAASDLPASLGTHGRRELGGCLTHWARSSEPGARLELGPASPWIEHGLHQGLGGKPW